MQAMIAPLRTAAGAVRRLSGLALGPSAEAITTAFGRQVVLGQTASLAKVFSAAQVKTFAELTGDLNPLHTEPSYAANTRFGRCIVHGVLINS